MTPCGPLRAGQIRHVPSPTPACPGYPPENRRDPGNGGPAVEARLYGAQKLAAGAAGEILYYLTDLARAPDGTLYVAQPDDNRIRKRSPDGRVSVFRKILEPAMLSVG